MGGELNRALLELAAFPLRQTTPDTEAFVMRQGVLKAIVLDVAP
jgi:hypothetical protein